MKSFPLSLSLCIILVKSRFTDSLDTRTNGKPVIFDNEDKYQPAEHHGNNALKSDANSHSMNRNHYQAPSSQYHPPPAQPNYYGAPQTYASGNQAPYQPNANNHYDKRPSPPNNGVQQVDAGNRIAASNKIGSTVNPADFSQESDVQAFTNTKIESIDSKASAILQRGLTELSISLGNTMLSLNPVNKNVVFSPLSIVSALALVLLGASGDTHRELVSFMGYTTGRNLDDKSAAIHKALGFIFETLQKRMEADKARGSEIAVAQGIFYDDKYTLQANYKKLAFKLYRSEIHDLDFQNPNAAERVNSWVANRTDGKITSLFSGPLPASLSIILANVIFFNGEWEYPFPKPTQWDTFEYHKNNQEHRSVKVQMMVNFQKVDYHHDEDYQILGLPYKGKEVYMYYILPHDPDLPAFTKSLTAAKLNQMINQTVTQEVIYVVPKMRLTNSVEMKPVLNALNVNAMFDCSKSDLTHMLGGGEDGKSDVNLCVDQVFHKVDVEVTEEGTVAAASTGIFVTRITKPTIRVNRPFLFLIYQKSLNLILFWGTVFKPEPYTEVL